MASKAVVPDQPRVGGGKQNGEGRNRRVLRDIGNLVNGAPAAEVEVLEKPHNHQITRPITRSFGAQLLANAQASADRNNCKKPLADNVGKEVAAKAITKKEHIIIKPKNDAVIVISSDEEGSHKSGRKVKKSEKTKPSKTLTSVLTARSKAACGLTEKPKDLPVDIDAADVNDELAAVEYVEDMYNFYKLTEEDGRVEDYMNTQPEINTKMRAIVVDWLIEIHKNFELMPESLYLTVNIMDRFLAMKTVTRKELQLVAISSMLIACKYEEIWAPEVSDFIAISDNAYIREQVLLMEKTILGKLEWYLTVPTPYVFLVRYIKAADGGDVQENEMKNMTFLYAEFGLMNYSTILEYSPSKLSASAVYAARCTLKTSPSWTETLKHYTGYSEDDLIECAKMLVGFHFHSENKLKTVYRKYSNPERGAVALFPPPASLLSTCSF